MFCFERLQAENNQQKYVSHLEENSAAQAPNSQQIWYI